MLERIEQADHGAQESRKGTRRHGPGYAGVGRDVHDPGHRNGRNELNHRIAGRLGQRPFHQQLAVAFVDLIETARLIVLGAKDLGQPLTLDHFLRGGGEIAHRMLDARADAAKALADPADQYSNHRGDQQREDREPGIQIEHQRHEADHLQTVPDHHRYGLGRCVGDLIDVEGQARQELPRSIAIIKALGSRRK